MNSLILILLPLVAYGKWVVEQENSGLFEGDIILTPSQMQDVKTGHFGFASTKKNLWPKTIPYDFGPKIAVSPDAIKAIDAAIASYHRHTCLRFVRRTNQPGYIRFYQGGGCSSSVGYFKRVNHISLASGCWHRGTVMHEIAHSLGIYHEQSRPDRDNYVYIRLENIPDGLEYNFSKQKATNIDSLGTPYDFKSMMHYGKTAFGSGKLTIQTIDPAMQDVIGQRDGFSKIDAQQINKMYHCGNIVPPPTKAPIPECKDIIKDCYKNLDKCNDPAAGWSKYMQTNCRKSCKVCGGGGTKPDCKDITTRCSANVGKCNDPSAGWKNYMHTNCRKTCNLCSGGGTKPDCKDKNTRCNQHVKNCNNADSGWVSWIKNNCAKTCNKC